MASIRSLCLIVLAGLLGGCATTGVVFQDEADRLDKPVAELAEHALLDVWIAAFEPGELPVGDLAAGLSLDIREAEGRYIPIQLADTMEKTGYWGSVRVVPAVSAGGEVLVRGRILSSDGGELRLAISASDATGRIWFARDYGLTIDAGAYASPTQGAEVFQGLYNLIANDLASYRKGLTVDDVAEIRRVAEMRFATELAPDAFARFLQVDEAGRYRIVGLPAEDDPMYLRIRSIRERDYMLLDTLNGHFDNFYFEMQAPYAEWRTARSEEVEAFRAIKREAWQRKALGVAAIVGAIGLSAFGDSDTRIRTDTLRDVMVIGGIYGVKSGFDKDEESTIHRVAIEELDASFSAEAQPLVVEVEGETHELTGSAEVQYAKWRDLLRQIYASETGWVDQGN